MKMLPTLLTGIALGLSASSLPIARNDGITYRRGPSGSSKRNQERAVKRIAQRSRAINRMRRK